MNVLGIHDGHNASAALLRDGELVAAVQEERFTRVKNQGGFPGRSVEAVLQLAGMRRDEVDVFAAGDRFHYGFLEWDRESVLRRFEAGGRSPARIYAGELKPVRRLRKNQLAGARRQRLLAAGLPGDRTAIVEHHECHAAAAYYGQGILDEPVLVLTADGVGDYLSATVNVGQDGALKRIAQVPDVDSLGLLFAHVTFLMGMMPLEHEHKVMGLAPYGSKATEHVQRMQQKFQRLFRFEGDGVTWASANRSKTIMDSPEQLKPLLYRERFDWIAAGLQNFAEEMLLTWVESCIRRTGIRRVALGGGLFMNVKANQRILESDAVESLFVMPSCGDETNSIGAAYAAHAGRRRREGAPVDIRPLRHLYLGPSIDDEQAESALRAIGPAANLRWDRPENPEREVARLLRSGAAVARAAGPMEFGARALGNRSILADSSRPDMVRVINDMIKDRDFWMPFAPSLLAERATDYVTKPKDVSTPYMMLAFESRPEKRDALVAARHPSDGTVRIQEVVRELNPGYYGLIEEFAELSGESVVLNTSFNLHGFPIVSTAEDALDVLQNSGLEYLQLSSFIVSKGGDGAGGPPPPSSA